MKFHGNRLESGRSKGCVSCSLKNRFNTGPLLGMMTRIKNSAKRRNIEITITEQELYDLLIKQNFKCALTGTNLILGKCYKRNIETTASVDRIDSNKGYIFGNVQWVHKKINVIKMNLNQNEFIELCNLVTKHSTSKGVEKFVAESISKSGHAQ